MCRMAKQGLGSQLARMMGRTLGRVRRGKARGAAYPGDFQGTPEISYEPNPGNGKVADPGGVRREGAVLDKGRFNQVAAALRRPAP